MPADFTAERSENIYKAFLLGRVRHEDPEYLPTLRALGAGPDGFLPLRKALELAKKFQPFDPDTHAPQDPTNPKKAFPNALRLAIADKLGLVEKKDLDRLRYYTTVESPLDTFHATNCVIEFQSKASKAGSFIAPFNVTLRDPEEKAEQEGIIIVRGGLLEENSPEFLKEVDKIAAQAVPFIAGSRRAA